MALVRRTEAFFIVAALAGAGWTLSASELWVAAQRAMPSWGRGRMNAAVMMISQGAMVLGGTTWGLVVAMAGATCALLWAAVLFLLSLLLAGRLRLSINLTPNLGASPALARKNHQQAQVRTGLTGYINRSMSKSRSRSSQTKEP